MNAPGSVVRQILVCLAVTFAAACVAEDTDTEPVKRIFISRAVHEGSFGGLAAADAQCNLYASAAEIGGAWTAWLSDSATDAIDRIEDVGPWYLVDEVTRVFNNKDGMRSVPINPIALDEYGDVNEIWVWTGTELGGTRAENVCFDWPDAFVGAIPVGAAGYSGFISNGWTYEDRSADCRSTYGLYCIEQ